jgi:hypothetical protein
MGRGCGGEAPAGYFTLNYYSPFKNSTKCPPMTISHCIGNEYRRFTFELLVCFISPTHQS